MDINDKKKRLFDWIENMDEQAIDELIAEYLDNEESTCCSVAKLPPLECCSAASLPQDNYSMDKDCKHIYRNGVLYGAIHMHNKTERTITFSVISDNPFLNSTIRTLNY